MKRYENEFDLHKNELLGETHFPKNGFALRLVFPEANQNSKMGYSTPKGNQFGRGSSSF